MTEVLLLPCETLLSGIWAKGCMNEFHENSRVSGCCLWLSVMTVYRLVKMRKRFIKDYLLQVSDRKCNFAARVFYQHLLNLGLVRTP
jgi:hypothetical protein